MIRYLACRSHVLLGNQKTLHGTTNYSQDKSGCFKLPKGLLRVLGPLKTRKTRDKESVISRYPSDFRNGGNLVVMWRTNTKVIKSKRPSRAHGLLFCLIPEFPCLNYMHDVMWRSCHTTPHCSFPLAKEFVHKIVDKTSIKILRQKRKSALK